MFLGDDTRDHDREILRTPEEVLDVYAVELDPILDGFFGALIELYFVGDSDGDSDGDVAGDVPCNVYEVRESALGSGNRLSVFRTHDQRLARAVFESRYHSFEMSAGAFCGVRPFLSPP